MGPAAAELHTSDSGRSTSRILMTLGWLRWRRILSSRRIRFDSVACEKALQIFLIATLCVGSDRAFGSRAAHTSPSAGVQANR